jgi:hypothetical protein
VRRIGVEASRLAAMEAATRRKDEDAAAVQHALSMSRDECASLREELAAANQRLHEAQQRVRSPARER